MIDKAGNQAAEKAVLDLINAAVAIIDGLHDVPSQDSIDNDQMRDVIGNKTDTHSGNSLSSFAHTAHEHFHSPVFIRPNLANSIALTSESGSWAAFPATKTEIIPAGDITFDFDLHFLDISDISANGEYQIELYKGGTGSEISIGNFGPARTAVQSQEGSRPILTEMLSANTRVSAALSSSNAGSNTLTIKLEGHKY